MGLSLTSVGFISLLNLEIYCHQNKTPNSLFVGFALFSFLCIDFCGMLFSGSILPFVSRHIQNSEKKRFFQICSHTESTSRLLGILMMTTYFFLAEPSNPFRLQFSLPFRTNLELAYFLAILLNLVATLTVLLFWPTFFVLSKPPPYFSGGVRRILESLGPEVRARVLFESLFVGLNKFCQVNLPGVICSRVVNSFQSFAFLTEVKPLDVGASYGALSLFCFSVLSAFTRPLTSTRVRSFWSLAFIFLRAAFAFLAFFFYER